MNKSVKTQSEPEQKDSHHVHFEEKGDSFGKNNEIIVQKSSDNKLSVHLGFLQVNHRYAIKFTVSNALINITKNVEITFVEPAIPNKNLDLISIDIKQDNLEFCVVLFAYKEKLLKEEFTFRILNKITVTAILNARVLGKGKGTPLLRNNIHCIGQDDNDEESEVSDWAGYD
uniref:Adipose-secreted signaling protein n=1 Tax=Clastoptera arizonana TaxID=38151 RepID=A0A1B6CPE3_9HEMI